MRLRSVPAVIFAFGFALALAGCGGTPETPATEPSFYRSMARPGAQVDAEAAASMISGYRNNNGLGTIHVDPVLSRAGRTAGARHGTA